MRIWVRPPARGPGVGFAAGGNLATAADAETGCAGSGACSKASPVAFIVTIHVKSGREEEFLRLLMPVLDAMRHEATFINAVLHRDPEDPVRFMPYETWADLDEVAQVQIQREYRKAYMDRLPEILREDRQIPVWQPLCGDFMFAASA